MLSQTLFSGRDNGWASDDSQRLKPGASRRIIGKKRKVDFVMIKEFKTKIKATILTVGAWIAVMASQTPVLAVGLTPQTPDAVSDIVVSTLNDVLVPIGGLVIFVTVVISAFKIIATANKPNERAEALSSLPYIAGGGLLLGGALLASGLIYGLMQTIHT